MNQKNTVTFAISIILYVILLLNLVGHNSTSFQTILNENFILNTMSLFLRITYSLMLLKGAHDALSKSVVCQQ